MKPLLSYYGGKQRLVSKILPIIEDIPHKNYVEPFAGGASLLFAKPIRHNTPVKHYRECLNDIDNRLITLYKLVKNQSSQLLCLLKNTLYSEYEYELSKHIIKNPHEHTDIEIAWAFYIGTQQGFAKKLSAGWGYCTTNGNHAQAWQAKLNSLELIFERLKGVYLSNCDALECIQKWDSQDTFFYCDPPYPGTNQGHYSGYTLTDYQNLIHKLQEIKGFFVLSNYCQDVVLPDTWNKVEIDASMSAANSKVKVNRHRKELVITNMQIHHLPIFASDKRSSTDGAVLPTRRF